MRYGSVIDVIIVDDYGFVNMSSLEGAELAIQDCNSFPLDKEVRTLNK